MRVIGIDPGLRRMGWGVIEARGGRIAHVASGTCEGRGDGLAERLLSLHEGLSAVIAAHAPEAAAVEETFVNRDGRATLKLGQARGIALLVPARFGLTVAEYAPNAVKKAVCGAGHAGKEQVGRMVRMTLPGAAPEGADAADALAVALCHVFTGGGAARLAAAVAGADR